ncbi:MULTISPECIES: helix-turn-helix domain-containing protein [Paenarthrobacter]|uniref:helix-turn-helix domain-containing protein n=1 Tax=Paenarthrobacter TaxID=1742992 RepID=UPI0021C5D63E|nr:helix-turn-helix domain-containing protein [Paenarthrobacter sp. JL.01a]UXM93305.1 helix-turn-helix domain-containing protein [Paenarthrobacter sp. JL.01a]
MTVEQLATVLCIGRQQAYEAVSRGDIPAIRLGRRILISTQVIRNILAEGSIPEQVA